MEWTQGSRRAEALDSYGDEPSRSTMPVSLLPDGLAGAPQEPLSLGPGSALKHYEIIRELGRGGMGRVYLARDNRLGRLCAIKLLLAYTGERAGRLLSEAQATARCKHEHIVVIYEVDEVRGCPYMVLEYIEGRTLRAWMREREPAGSLPPRLAAELMIPVVQALVCAHEMGIVHRDLKPENILLTAGGQVKVLDFGVAKVVSPQPAPAYGEGVSAAGDARGTTEDGVVGTPPYMSPEQRMGGDVDAQTDLWAVGIMLYELVVGVHPLAPTTPARLATVCDLERPMPSIEVRGQGAGALATIVDRCLKKRRAERFGSARQLLAELEALVRGSPALLGDDNPFAGLSAFQESGEARFFGRERDTAAVFGRLRQQQLVVVAGPSGAGKSSLVRAGVIPALKRSGGRWQALILRPGRRPLAALADALARLSGAGDGEALAELLRSQPGLVGARLRAHCRAGGSEHVLLFVDQFEELYTLAASAAERAIFLACLEGAADETSSPVRVVLAIRSDFLDRIADDRRFTSEVTRGLVLLSPLGREDLRRALVRPIEMAGYRFEGEELIEEMLEMLEHTRSPLPLLQFTATLLWEARDGERRLLSRASYRALGGVAGALSTHADAVLVTLSAREQRLARSILLRLVTPERTRAIVALAELRALSDGDDAAEQVVQRLAGARLLQIETGDEREGATVELVHESLIDRWTRLGAWLEENEHDALFLARLRAAAQQWQTSRRIAGLLWRDHAAEEALAWRKRRGAEQETAARVALTVHEEHYLAAVVELFERGQRSRRRRIAGVIAVLTGIVLVVSYLALRAEREATRARDETARAEAQALRADEEARQARNATRMAATRELQTRDPTTALAVLRELEPPGLPREWADLGLQALAGGIHDRPTMHPMRVHGAAFSPDERSIVTASADGISRIWNADGSGEPRALVGHEGEVHTAAWSPDGRWIATASGDRTVRVWDLDGGEPVVLRGHEGAVSAANWSPDGAWIVSASADHSVRIWRRDGSGEPRVLRGHTDRVRWAAWSPDGARIVSAGDDETARVWPVDGGGEPVVLRGHTSGLYMAAWSPDGARIVAVANDGTTRLWRADGIGESQVRTDHDGPVFTAAWSPDGESIVTGSYDATMAVWRVDGSGAPLVLRGHEGAVHGAAWSGDGRRILSASWDRSVRRWTLPPRDQPRIVRAGEQQFFAATWRPDGQQIVTAHPDGIARIWSVADGAAIRLVRALQGHEGAVYAAEWSPDARRIATISTDANLRLWNVDDEAPPRVLRGHEQWLGSVSWSPDGRYIATSAGDATVRVWDAEGAGEPRVLRGHAEAVNVVRWSPDGRRLVTGSLDKTARVWTFTGAEEPQVFAGHHESVMCVAWSPDGEHIVTTSEDSTARVWRVGAAEEPRVLRGHAGGVTRAMWSPDGQRIATASKDRTVRIWPVNGGDEPLVLRGHTAEVYTVAWSPDGQRIVTASMDGTARLWTELTPLTSIDDARLWTATRACIGVERRIALLNLPEATAAAHDAACRRRVERALD